MIQSLTELPVEVVQLAKVPLSKSPFIREPLIHDGEETAVAENVDAVVVLKIALVLGATVGEGLCVELNRELEKVLDSM